MKIDLSNLPKRAQDTPIQKRDLDVKQSAGLDNLHHGIFARFKAEAPVGSFFGPASELEISSAEAELGVSFPNGYKQFLRLFGAADWPDYIAGVGKGLIRSLQFVSLTLQERTEAIPQLAHDLVAFSPDGRGNHYCLDTCQMADEECPVIIWNHDGTSDQRRQMTNQSFADWLSEQINWELEFEAECASEDDADSKKTFDSD